MPESPFPATRAALLTHRGHLGREQTADFAELAAIRRRINERSIAIATIDQAMIASILSTDPPDALVLDATAKTWQIQGDRMRQLSFVDRSVLVQAAPEPEAASSGCDCERCDIQRRLAAAEPVVMDGQLVPDAPVELTDEGASWRLLGGVIYRDYGREPEECGGCGSESPAARQIHSRGDC